MNTISGQHLTIQSQIISQTIYFLCSTEALPAFGSFYEAVGSAMLPALQVAGVLIQVLFLNKGL